MDCLLGPFVYGFLESSLNALFPVYALRKGFEVGMIPIILSVFTFGGILTQVPLGALGDKVGRRNILMIGSFGGAIILRLQAFRAFTIRCGCRIFLNGYAWLARCFL